MDVNLNGFFNVTQKLMLPMMKTRWGRIINLSSVAGVTSLNHIMDTVTKNFLTFEKVKTLIKSNNFI
jgi:NAD(P)-dependent dehydrogenase (short-subunit alcohol dehydrogenase family)